MKMLVCIDPLLTLCAMAQGKLHALRGQISYAMEQYEVRCLLF